AVAVVAWFVATTIRDPIVGVTVVCMLIALLVWVLILRWLSNVTRSMAPAGCFPCSAPVMTPGGRRLLGDVAVGDPILSWSERAQRWVAERVVSRRVVRDAEVIQVRLGGQEESLR